MESDSPTVARRRVRLALREAREAAGCTQQQLAEKMEWSLSKVIRIENGDVSISPTDLRPMLNFLGIKDQKTVSALVADARTARTRQRRAWHQQPEFREQLPYGMRLLIEYEADALVARYYSALFLPDLLQTDTYAARLSEAEAHQRFAQWRRAVPQALEFRRQALLSRQPPADIRVLLDESVLRRTVGGADIMADQLRQLRRWATDRVLRIRMYPFSVDAVVIDYPAFDLVSLGADDRQTVLYPENCAADEINEDAGTTSHYRDRFDQMWNTAVPEEGSLDFIQNRIEYLEAVSGYRRKAAEVHHID